MFQLAEYYLIMSTSNAVSEQSFSVLRWIKTYLRNTMIQNSLNHTVCLNIYTEGPMQINLKEILNEFVNSSDKGKKFFVKFFDQ